MYEENKNNKTFTISFTNHLYWSFWIFLENIDIDIDIDYQKINSL